MVVKNYDTPLTIVGGGEFSSTNFHKCLKIAPKIISRPVFGHCSALLNSFWLSICMHLGTNISKILTTCEGLGPQK